MRRVVLAADRTEQAEAPATSDAADERVVYAHMPAIIAADVVFYQHSSEARRLAELVARRERIPVDKDVCRERQYIGCNQESMHAHTRLAAAAYSVRRRLVDQLPVQRARLAEGGRFIAGLEDVYEGGGIDFEETYAPVQTLLGFVLQTSSGTRWLVCESGIVTRGTQLMAGGVCRPARVVCPDAGDPPKALAPGARSGLDFSVSSGNSRALVCIKLGPVDEVGAIHGPPSNQKTRRTEAMAPHQQRVIDERSELDDKRNKLYAFIDGSPVFKGLPSEEQARLRRQSDVMAEYSGILGERIAAFPAHRDSPG